MVRRGAVAAHPAPLPQSGPPQPVSRVAHLPHHRLECLRLFCLLPQGSVRRPSAAALLVLPFLAALLAPEPATAENNAVHVAYLTDCTQYSDWCAD
jgi:hypothetical protein